MKDPNKLWTKWYDPAKSYNIKVDDDSFVAKIKKEKPVKPVWTEEQKEYLDNMESRINKRMDDGFSLIIDILARNGIK